MSPKVEILTQAKSLIDTPEKWCKKAFAFDSKMCLVGALNQATNQVSKKDYQVVTECFDLLKEVWGEVSGLKILTSYNDTHTHQEVMKLFDDAIKLASIEKEIST